MAIWFLAVIGAGVLVLALIVCSMMTVSYYLDWRHEPHRRSYQEGRSDQRNALLSDSWWFGESPETAGLLQDLARGMGVSEARERWRKARQKPEEPANGH